MSRHAISERVRAVLDAMQPGDFLAWSTLYSWIPRARPAYLRDAFRQEIAFRQEFRIVPYSGIGRRPSAAAAPRSVFEYVFENGNCVGFEPQKKPTPTKVCPGPQKVPVLAARLQRGESLWHPEDAGDFSDFPTDS